MEKHSTPAGEKNGHTDSLIEEEEGINDHTVVQKCAEIQIAISEGEQFIVLSYSTELIYIYIYIYFQFFSSDLGTLGVTRHCDRYYEIEFSPRQYCDIYYQKIESLPEEIL